MGGVKNLFSGPELPEPEKAPPKPEEDANALGKARVEAMRLARRRSALNNVFTNPTMGVTGAPRTRGSGVMGQ